MTQQNQFPVRSISTGFLVGNLLAGISSHDALKVDEEACAAAYAEAVEEAIRRQFPEADIDVDYQFASGCLPRTLETAVDCGSSDLAGDDFDTYCEASRIEEAVAEQVNAICGEVFESSEWWREKERTDWYLVHDGEAYGLDHDQAVALQTGSDEAEGLFLKITGNEDDYEETTLWVVTLAADKEDAKLLADAWDRNQIQHDNVYCEACGTSHATLVC